jgi:hypothetical protein
MKKIAMTLAALSLTALTAFAAVSTLTGCDDGGQGEGEAEGEAE